MEKIYWAPKLQQSKIWQLYQNDAAGMVEDSLVWEVGYDLFQRCRSIWLVTHRQVECPRCGTTFDTCEPDSWKMLPGTLVCPKEGCGWETTSAQWHDTWRHKELLGTAAMGSTETYLRDYPLAKKTTDLMVCIDQLIHSFHISLRTGKRNRAFANNLIEGSHEQVVELLDRLFAKEGGVDKEEWRSEIKDMYKTRRGQD